MFQAQAIMLAQKHMRTLLSECFGVQIGPTSLGRI